MLFMQCAFFLRLLFGNNGNTEHRAEDYRRKNDVPWLRELRIISLIKDETYDQRKNIADIESNGIGYLPSFSGIGFFLKVIPTPSVTAGTK